MSSNGSDAPSDFALDASHGLSTGLITVAMAKGWTMSQGLNVDMMPQLEAGLAAGASSVVVDSLMPGSDVMIKAGATGAVLAGAMYAWKGDQNAWLWIPVGAGSYWLSDWAMTSWAKMAEKKKLGTNGGGRRTGGATSDVPTVPGM
jgi:hypothetical protein